MDRGDIQGFVLHGYPSTPFARFHFLSFGEGNSRRLLSRLAYDVCTADEPEVQLGHQLGLTAHGLRALGLGDAELAQFPREFVQGLAHPERCAALGVLTTGGPESWSIGGAQSGSAALDAVWLSFAPSAALRDERALSHERQFERFAVAWSGHDAQRVPNPQKIKESRRRRRKGALARGEIVLGERDAAGLVARGPLVAPKHGFRELPPWLPRERALDFGRSGSFLALLCFPDAEPGAAGPLQQSYAARTDCRIYSVEGLQPRGLWASALNVDFRRQFELAEQERASSASRDSHQSESALRSCGGGYFFLPGRRALNYLAESGT